MLKNLSNSPLAPVTPAATVDHGAGLQRLQLRCDTLVIDTDRGLAMLVWRAHVLLDRADRPGRVVVTGPGAPEVAPSAWDDDDLDVEGTLAPDAVMLSSAVLPFSGAAARASSSAPPRATTGEVAPASADAATERSARSRLDATTPSLAGDPLERTEAAGLVVLSSMLPFASTPQSPPAPAPPRAAAAPEPPRAHAPLSATAAEPRSLPWPPPPASTASPAPYRPATEAGARAERLLDPAASPAGETPAPPPLLGAIAVVSAGPAEAPGSGRHPVAGAGAVAPAPDVTFDAYPPERCGAIAARLACDEGSTGDILRAEELDEAGWRRVHARWLDRIRDEAARSRTRLLSAYDSAYVSALEAKRGPIAVGDYARLAEAAERGAIAGALAARGLPEGAWPHLHRVWIRRMVKDARLGKQVRREIDALREAG
ncbi:hypothetical protein WMF01_18655 [Sorangium sp. So ce1667]